MRAGNTAGSWGWVARAFHWTMAGLILFQLGLGLYMVELEPDLLERFRLTQLHKSWGFVIFALALARVAWRLANRRHPPIPAATPRWQVRAAAASHAALYGLMVLLPLSGWVMAASAPAQDVLQIENMVFGVFALPDPWVPGVEAVERAAKAVHVAAAILLALVLAVHVAAALRHHFVDRDDVLARMTWGP
jgi:cytochrome b561